VLVATWNVNSIKARHDRLLAFLARHSPDVVCLQETKVQDEAFPAESLRAAGYTFAHLGQRAYNGVAILCRGPHVLEDVATGLDDGVVEDQSRLIAATVGGVRFVSAYWPNGGAHGTDKFTYKLEWIARLREHLARKYAPDRPLALCGDFNVAPDDADVARPDQWRSSVLTHDDARAALEMVRAWGFVDVFRKHNPDGHVYTWWDYRMLSFPKGDGLRIDHVFATAPLAGRSRAASVDRNERKGKLPSDHAPVLVTFDD